jgi:hypothetical protein
MPRSPNQTRARNHGRQIVGQPIQSCLAPNSTGSLHGVSAKRRAVQRWFERRQAWAALEACEGMCGAKTPSESLEAYQKWVGGVFERLAADGLAYQQDVPARAHGGNRRACSITRSIQPLKCTRLGPVLN